MSKDDNRADVDRLKQILTGGWNRVRAEVPDERVYAFGVYTNGMGQMMFPFLLGEKGLERVARRYVERGTYDAASAADNLRWSTADSPYGQTLSQTVHEFEGRPDLFSLSATAMAREVRYRLTAGCDALRELDEQGLFGTGAQREDITLYIEGGDVNREWRLKWAKALNPPKVYKQFAQIGAPKETTGAFTEFGTKKVYETKQYAQSTDGRLVAAATQYLLFLFDAVTPKQLFARALPGQDDHAALGGVAMSGDGAVIAAIPFGSGKHGSEFFIVTGAKGETVKTVALKSRPCAVAVSPAGDWIAVTDQAGALNLFDPSGQPIASHAGHAAWPRGIAVSPDGATLATADAKSLVIWETSNWSKRLEKAQVIDNIDFDPTGRFIAGCCVYPGKGLSPRGASIVDARDGAVTREVVVEGYRIRRARFSPDGRHLACAMRVDSEEYAATNVSAIVDVETGEVIDRLEADFEQVHDFAFLPERGEVAVAVFGHTRRPLVLWKPKMPA